MQNIRYSKESCRYQTKKRIAFPNEKIIITDCHFASEFVEGDVFTVKERLKDSVTLKETHQHAYHWEYKVII